MAPDVLDAVPPAAAITAKLSIPLLPSDDGCQPAALPRHRPPAPIAAQRKLSDDFCWRPKGKSHQRLSSDAPPRCRGDDCHGLPDITQQMTPSDYRWRVDPIPPTFIVIALSPVIHQSRFHVFNGQRPLAGNGYPAMASIRWRDMYPAMFFHRSCLCDYIAGYSIVDCLARGISFGGFHSAGVWRLLSGAAYPNVSRKSPWNPIVDCPTG